MAEQWKSVVGYEGLYMVSDMGRICSMARQVDRPFGKPHQRKERLLSVYIDKTSHGYRCVTLRKDGAAKKMNVHPLVLAAFVGPRPSDEHHACHNNGDRTDARLINLRWDTRAANAADRIAHGTAPIGEKSPRAILTSLQVTEVLQSAMPSKQIAKLYGVASSTIRAIRIGKNWKHMTKDTRDELEDKYIAKTQALGREAGRRELKDAA